jgi:hypothetical protein
VQTGSTAAAATCERKSALRNSSISYTPKSPTAVSFSFHSSANGNKNVYDKSDPKEFLNLLPTKN